MNKIDLNKWLILCICISLAGLLASCSQSSESALRKRVEAFWQAKVAQQFDKAYEIEAPVYRNLVDKNGYIRSQSPVITFHSFEIAEIKMDEDGKGADVTVKVNVTVRAPGAPPLNAPNSIVDRWVLSEDGKWYHVPRRMAVGHPSSS